MSYLGYVKLKYVTKKDLFYFFYARKELILVNCRRNEGATVELQLYYKIKL